ncbi:ABC transporter permease subunit [Spiroplasma chrysopicola]|uniref:Ribose/galactose ABC transporter permease n=1 Tax=Spiroplasma chrysopicola DF-1 TaxID=1276227 RepID=R4UH46_9MOLU|nr:ribose/galactose ABC transporter permease [Spiroplasma chrysopicola]AGM24631.1 ribose/galactose ABC transporter permease [Spiroplasma chrysopicola DF-1]
MGNIVKNKTWLVTQKTRIFFRSNEFKNKMNVVKASLCAILVGFLLSFIIIGINGSNPFLFFQYVFKLAFHPLLQNTTLTYWAIYIVAGLAVAVGFKAGLFNIGIPGQMLLAGSMSIVLGLKNPAISQGAGVVGAIAISILVGAGLAAIAGVLKAFFNIHEVVSTIMLNWIVWYVMKWMFMDLKNGLWNANNNSSIDITTAAPNFNLAINEQTWIIPMIIAVILLVGVIFMMNYTVLGFRIKAVGKSKTASLYAGTNIKAYTIASMAISGGIAGILGMIYYMTESTVIQFSTDALPVIGFDAIAVALVAFTNAVSIVPIALLWAIIKTAAMQATQLPQFQMSKEMGQLIFGLIIYMTAISAVFIYFKPILWFRRWLNIQKNPEFKAEDQTYQKEIKNNKLKIKAINKEYRLKLRELKQAKDKEAIVTLREKTNEKLTTLVGQNTTLKISRKFFVDTKYKAAANLGKRRIKTQYNKAIFSSIGLAMDQYVQFKNQYYLKKNEVSIFKQKHAKKMRELKGKMREEIKALRKAYKKDYLVEQTLLQSSYANLLSRHSDEIINLKEQNYHLFDEIQQKYGDNYQQFILEEKKATKTIEEQIKALKKQQKLEVVAFKQNYKVKRQELSKKLWKARKANQHDEELKRQISKIVETAMAEIANAQIHYLEELIVLKNSNRANQKNYAQEYNANVTLIINAVKEDNVILRQELLRKKSQYHNKTLKGGK